MGDILRIYSGGSVQVNLYDSTNGVLNLGFAAEEISVVSEAQSVGLSRGGGVQTKEIVSFTGEFLETDSTKIDNLIARKGYLQEIYIIGIDHAYKMKDAFIRINKIMSMKAGEAHKIVMTAERQQGAFTPEANNPESYYCQFIQNILGAFGDFESDVGGVGTGWENNGGTSLSTDTSHLAGGGDEQRITLSDAGDAFHCRVRFPLDQLSIKMTVSAYLDNLKAGTSYFQFGLRTVTTGLSITTQTEQMTLDEGANERISKEVTLTPVANTEYLDVVFIGSALGTAVLGIDHVQFEFGELTPYVENA